MTSITWSLVACGADLRCAVSGPSASSRSGWYPGPDADPTAVWAPRPSPHAPAVRAVAEPSGAPTGLLRIGIDDVARRAQRLHLAPRTLAQRYVEEGLRMDEHRLIRFAEGPAGRRARLVGTGKDVWEVIATVRDNSGDAAEAAATWRYRLAWSRPPSATTAQPPPARTEVDVAAERPSVQGGVAPLDLRLNGEAARWRRGGSGRCLVVEAGQPELARQIRSGWWKDN